ncbi:MAG: polysaccharide deacetylase family protein [Sandaracinaceae bacterium]
MNARWIAKKAARQGLALSRWASGSVSAERTVRRVLGSGAAVRALTYHRIGHEDREPFCVRPDVFEAHVRWLAERGLAASLDDVIGFVAGTRALPDGACLVTIDDGCESTLTEALPILARHRVPAVAFVTASLVGLSVDALPERYLDWDELREIASSGVMEIGSHAFTHRSLGAMPRPESRHEASESKRRLEDELGREVRSFAYPFGTRGDFDAFTERALADAGYSIAFNSMHGAVRAGMDPISLPRIKVEGGEGLWMFERLADGAMDAWRVIDQNLWRLQRVRQEIVG